MSAGELDFSHVARRARALDVGRASLDDAERALVVASWRSRMNFEYASARVFGDLVGQAMRAGLPPRVVADVARMATEEIRHAEACAEVLVNLDAAPTCAALGATPAAARHEDATARVAFARNVASVGCASETVAVALVESERAIAATPDLERVLTGILRDEIGHARLGWTALRKIVAELDARERRDLDRYLPTLFEHQLGHYGRLAELPPTTERARRAGAPDGRASLALFWETLEGVIVPGLEATGLDARAGLATAIERARARAA